MDPTPAWPVQAGASQLSSTTPRKILQRPHELQDVHRPPAQAQSQPPAPQEQAVPPHSPLGNHISRQSARVHPC